MKPNRDGQRFDVAPVWVVTRGTGRRAAEPLTWGCTFCLKGRACNCERHAKAYARMVGGTVERAREVFAAEGRAA